MHLVDRGAKVHSSHVDEIRGAGKCHGGTLENSMAQILSLCGQEDLYSGYKDPLRQPA
jgi:hypothetical protein